MCILCSPIKTSPCKSKITTPGFVNPVNRKVCSEVFVSNQITDNINTLVELTIVDQPSYSQTDIPASKETNRDRSLSPENNIIVDGIAAELQKGLRLSKKIRKELNKITLVTGMFEEAYSLPHGGIAIHLKEEKDRNHIIKNWSETNLGGNSVAH